MLHLFEYNNFNLCLYHRNTKKNQFCSMFEFSNQKKKNFIILTPFKLEFDENEKSIL